MEDGLEPRPKKLLEQVSDAIRVVDRHHEATADFAADATAWLIAEAPHDRLASAPKSVASSCRNPGGGASRPAVGLFLGRAVWYGRPCAPRTQPDAGFLCRNRPLLPELPPLCRRLGLPDQSPGRLHPADHPALDPQRHASAACSAACRPHPRFTAREALA